MRNNAIQRSQSGRIACLIAVILILNSICFRVLSQDIVLSDFEETNYVWLPGGVWTATGNSFGTGPARGALPNQQTVSGYLGSGLVNTYLNGDGSTGTLTSPPFAIQRTYIKFLIGAGNWRGKTCINLIIGGKIVASSVGMGDREQLSWLQWNVSAYTNQTAQLQIVDSSIAGWGHVNVDQINETDTSLAGGFIASQPYLNLPIQTGATKHLVELIHNGLVVREMNVELATTATNFWASMDLKPFQGQELLVRIDSQLATANQLATYFIQTNTLITSTPFYHESLRPIYHFTSRCGWNNDANGMVYFNGEYHLYYQHNQFGWGWDNMSWGNAITPDLVHWTELPEALYPDYLGTEFSGSAVVDWNNSAGFGTNAFVAIFCSAGGENRMSGGQPFTQSIAYSLDQGQSWTKYTNNPVLPNLVGGNRDPKVIWYAPANKWVMALYLSGNNFGFFSSSNLINWSQTSTFTLPNTSECPELFPLPLDENSKNHKWIFWAGGGNYVVGQFDGNSFTSEYGPFSLSHGNDFYAAQTFNNIPINDGRRILMAWANSGGYPSMPFNGGMTFPIQLTLNTITGTPLMFANPVNELSLLRISTNSWPTQPLASGINVMAGTTGEACELDVQFEPGTSTNITFTLRGTSVVYDNVARKVTCLGNSQPLSPVNGVVTFQILADRGSLEIFGNNGRLYMPMSVVPVAGALPISCMANGSGAQLISLHCYHLGSAWTSSNSQFPTFITAFSSRSPCRGRSAFLSVTSAGVGEAVPGAGNSTLYVFPASRTNLSYDVVVSNVGGSATSRVGVMTALVPYPVDCQRMESRSPRPTLPGHPLGWEASTWTPRMARAFI